MRILIVFLVSAGVLVLLGICCEIANKVDRKKDRKVEELIEKGE
jgi:hypothetical protein